MKKMTAFLTIALLVCIATFVAFAANQNRYASYSYLIVANPDDDLPHRFSDIDNTGTDGEGPLYSTASSWTGYYRNDNGELKFGASAYAYVSCYPDKDNYETTYSLRAEIPEDLSFVHKREPQVLPREGSFSESAYVSGEGIGAAFALGGASGSASASGKNPSNNAQHNTSAESPTRFTARDLEIINDYCDWCNGEGCSGCE